MLRVGVVPNDGDFEGLRGKVLAAGHREVVLDDGVVWFSPFETPPASFDWIGKVERHFDCEMCAIEPALPLV